MKRIIIALRIHQFSLAHGSCWFYNLVLAVDKHKFADNLATLEREHKRSKEDFIGKNMEAMTIQDFTTILWIRTLLR